MKRLAICLLFLASYARAQDSYNVTYAPVCPGCTREITGNIPVNKIISCGSSTVCYEDDAGKAVCISYNSAERIDCTMRPKCQHPCTILKGFCDDALWAGRATRHEYCQHQEVCDASDRWSLLLDQKATTLKPPRSWTPPAWLNCTQDMKTQKVKCEGVPR